MAATATENKTLVEETRPVLAPPAAPSAAPKSVLHQYTLESFQPGTVCVNTVLQELLKEHADAKEYRDVYALLFHVRHCEWFVAARHGKASVEEADRTTTALIRTLSKSLYSIQTWTTAFAARLVREKVLDLDKCSDFVDRMIMFLGQGMEQTKAAPSGDERKPFPEEMTVFHDTYGIAMVELVLEWYVVSYRNAISYCRSWHGRDLSLRGAEYLARREAERWCMNTYTLVCQGMTTEQINELQTTASRNSLGVTVAFAQQPV